MDLREMILEEHSKSQTNKIIDWVGNHQSRFDELVKLFLANEYRVTQRAAWPLSNIAIANPLFIKKHLQNLDHPQLHDAVKRNTLRFLQEIEIPKNLQGPIMSHCFNYIQQPGEAVAVKAFSLSIQKLSKLYPEILPEIKKIVEAQMPSQTAAFKVRARPFLN